ncbi:MAG: hypothetical protein ACFCVD_15305 [Nodosilinea sp.]
MTERNLELEYSREKLNSLEQRQTDLRKDIKVERSSTTRRQLEEELDQVFKEIDRVSADIKKSEAKQQEQTARNSTNQLVSLLDPYADQDEIQQAYQATLRHWPTVVNPHVTRSAERVRELNRIGPGPRDYTALEEFIACLIRQSNITELIIALNRWGQQHYPKRDWLNLYTQIDQARCEEYQPAILIVVTLAEEATTQASNEPHYQLKGWLIEDIATYRHQRTGYHPLLTAEATWAEPFRADDLEKMVLALINHGLTETNRRCEGCTNEAEFHIFLPKVLMHLAVDQWPVDTNRQPPVRLGHNHTVVVRCADRYAASYRRGPTWRRLWKRHEECCTNTADSCFVSWLGNWDDLVDILNTATDAEDILGLKCIAAPDLAELETVVDEFLESGLPLAIWGRCNLPTILNEKELDTILQAATLGDLPRQVYQKRRESRNWRNTPDSHIGHHLFLLRDDPTLVPPKSA